MCPGSKERLRARPLRAARSREVERAFLCHGYHSLCGGKRGAEGHAIISGQPSYSFWPGVSCFQTGHLPCHSIVPERPWIEQKPDGMIE